MKKRHALLALLVIGGCIEGGANLGGRQPGNRDGGHFLAIGDIAVDLRGRYFLSRADGQLVVGDLQSQTMSELASLPRPDLVAFWTHTPKPGFFLLSWDGIESDGGESSGKETVLSYDLTTKTIVWQRTIERLDGRLDVSPEGARVLLSDGESVAILDPATGTTLHTIQRDDGIGDLDFTPDGTRLIVTGQTARDEARRPFTTISVHAAATAEELCRVTVPNCSSELVLTRDGHRAFLAPTICGRDPVSVIDLEGDRCSFHGNLAGFGPVALSPDGETIVSFADRDARDPEAPALPASVTTSALRYHLLFIDTETLAAETTPIGDVLPRYTFTPDGRSLLVDSNQSAKEPIVILDAHARTMRRVTNDGVNLEEYALSPDATHAWVIDDGLWDLDIARATLTKIALPFVPRSINMTPDGTKLLLKGSIEGSVFVFEIESGRVVGEVIAG